MFLKGELVLKLKYVFSKNQQRCLEKKEISFQSNIMTTHINVHIFKELILFQSLINMNI